jgi:hypothetical protein
MCLKKVISLLIILLANMVLLAHPVVRYIQYSSYSQTSVTICPAIQTHNYCKKGLLTTHNTKAASCKHTHNCSKNTIQHNCPDNKTERKCCDKDKCLMHNLFSHDNSIKLPKPVSNDFDFNISNISDCQITQITDLTGIPFRQKPYIPHVYADYSSQSIGLRAPPVC